ncbi:MAG: hypothetical protein K2K36_05355, partial [Muribaculaceae bacterium]|nr:hypothetical protein [Muribaculaceae bacterium]
LHKGFRRDRQLLIRDRTEATVDAHSYVLLHRFLPVQQPKALHGGLVYWYMRGLLALSVLL